MFGRRPVDVARTAALLVAVCGALVLGAMALAGWLAGSASGWSPEALLGLGALLALGALVAWIGASDVSGDVAEIGRHVDGLVREGPRAAGELRGEGQDGGRAETWAPLRVASADELGELVWRFETLRRHFVETLDRETQSRQRAEDADRFKTEFLHTVSHELRTPLNAILGFTDVLRKELDGPLNESQHEDLAIIRNAGTHLVSLFNDVLDLSAAATGDLELVPEQVEVGPLLEAVARELEGQRGERPVEIRVERGGEPVVDADPKRLRQVLTNLATNALKFTEQGEVVLGASDDVDGARLWVRDTGPGISPEDVQLIFQEFGQSEGEMRRRRGSGLGLAIARQLVELHGGRLDVQTELGEGSTFTVWLPRRRDAGRAA